MESGYYIMEQGGIRDTIRFDSKRDIFHNGDTFEEPAKEFMSNNVVLLAKINLETLEIEKL